MAQEREAQNQAYHGQNRDDEDENLCSFPHIAHFLLLLDLQMGFESIDKMVLVFRGLDEMGLG